MLLFDVFYVDGDFDPDRPLPDKADDGDRAICTNGPKRTYVWRAGDWRLETPKA